MESRLQLAVAFPGRRLPRFSAAAKSRRAAPPTMAEETEVPNLDRDLLERYLVLGDESAFAVLFDRLAPLVYGLAMRLSGRAEDAADLTQEVFLKILRGLGQFRGEASLKTWIYRIAWNELANRIAARQRQRRVFAEPATSDDEHEGEVQARLRSADPDPESSLLARERQRQVAAAVAALPAEFKATVVLRDLEGLAYEEVAEVLGVPIGTVRSRLARGRALLRLSLAAYIRPGAVS